MNHSGSNSISYNSAYISLNLLDELDYCLGGYGSPNVEFIFTLNTFVETFIGCSQFYTSLDELNHLNLTAPAIFPNGRPILNLVVKEGGLKFVSGVIELPGRVIYQSDIFGQTRKQAQQEFIKQSGSQFFEKYFIKSDLAQIVEKIPLLTSEFSNGQFVVSEVLGTSMELISNLINVSNASSIQTTLPIYLFNQQVNALAQTPYSIQSLQRISKLFNASLQDLQNSLGYRFLPIPPFTNILLSQINSLSDIPLKLSQLRADYQELRQKFVELEKEIYGAKNVKEQLEAYKSFEEFWKVFNRKYVDKSNRIFYGHLDIGAGVDIDKGADSLIEGGNLSASLKDMNLGKLVGNVVSKVYHWGNDRRVINRFKGITNIWELFGESVNIMQQLKHFEKLFGVQFSNHDISRVKNFVTNGITDIRKEIRL